MDLTWHPQAVEWSDVKFVGLTDIFERPFKGGLGHGLRPKAAALEQQKTIGRWFWCFLVARGGIDQG